MRDEVRTGTVLSDAFARQGVFPPIYITSVLAGEKSGAFAEVLDRYHHLSEADTGGSQEIAGLTALSGVLICLVDCLMVFLITYVVPNFAALYNSMEAKLPTATVILIAVGTTARNYVLARSRRAGGGGCRAYFWSRRE